MHQDEIINIADFEKDELYLLYPGSLNEWYIYHQGYDKV